MILNKGATTPQWGEDGLFDDWGWENWTSPARGAPRAPTSHVHGSQVGETDGLTAGAESVELLEDTQGGASGWVWQ